MATKMSRSATYSGRADKIKTENDTLVTQYTSYDDSAVRSPMSDNSPTLTGVGLDLRDTSLLLVGSVDGLADERDASLVRRSLSQRITSSLNAKLPSRLRSRAHALGRRRTSTRIDDSFIGISKNTPHYVMTMDSDNMIE